MLPLDATMAFSRHRPPATARSAMPVRSTSVAIRTLDGLRLAATLVTPGESAESAVVLVHGGGVTREEGGFFTRLAAGLVTATCALVEIEGSQHGFAVHDDPQYLNPQSRIWQTSVIETVVSWLRAGD
ncbi:hypothetical protein ACQP2T_15710 [Nonomuraea sp. CA-143628]|uniref:hypothetical protein n=1 Tax=Nonomuraea sp. CA-143628 TaxID=3239997 RepID=UPI003D89F6BA